MRKSEKVRESSRRLEKGGEGGEKVEKVGGEDSTRSHMETNVDEDARLRELFRASSSLILLVTLLLELTSLKVISGTFRDADEDTREIR